MPEPMTETLRSILRDSLVHYRDRDFSTLSNEGIATYTDAWVAELVYEIQALTPPPLAVTEGERVNKSNCDKCGGGPVRVRTIDRDHGDVRWRCDNCGASGVEEGPNA